jgi:hypothetical protein
MLGSMGEAVILDERIAYAVERLAESAASRVFHLCWPSEYPLTLCGEIATEPAIRLKRRGLARGYECRSCYEVAASHDFPASRVNPHR